MNTDYQALQIKGRAPPAGHPDAEEYTRRFVAWTQQQVTAGRVTVGLLGTAQERADYEASR